MIYNINIYSTSIEIYCLQNYLLYLLSINFNIIIPMWTFLVMIFEYLNIFSRINCDFIDLRKKYYDIIFYIIIYYPQ